MKNKGFTLIELLVTIVILSLLSGIVVISSSSFFRTSEERYYDALESNILLAGNDYFDDHRDELPTGSNYSEVSLASLIDNSYMEKITDTKGNECRGGSVFAYRENNRLKYEVCIVGCGDYNSTGRYCSNKTSREITVVAKTKTTNKTYDVTKSYNSASYTKNENVVVTLGMNEAYNITKYIVRNTRDNTDIECTTVNKNSCVVEINKSGTYKIESYDGTAEISSRYINVKIARNGSNFSLDTSDGQRKYLISQDECSSNKKTKTVEINVIKGNPTEEYKMVEYKVNNGEYTEINKIPFKLTLESGHYDIDVVVTNYSDNVNVETISIDISYLLNIEYRDDNSTGTHEVVKGQIYNYLSSLPAKKSGVNVRWYKGNSEINPDSSLVDENCTYKIEGNPIIDYTITYNLNGGSVATANPTKYNFDTTTFTLNNPTRSGYTFIGWTDSNDYSSGLSSYTTASPYVAAVRDHKPGNEFSVTPGVTYRVIVTAKRTTGDIDLKGGIWYTELTSGTAYEKYDKFVLAEKLSDGWARYYRDVTVPSGKTKGKIFLQLDQYSDNYTTSWNIANMHVTLAPTSVSIAKGNMGNKTYTANWLANTYSVSLNNQSATSAGTDKVWYQYNTNKVVDGTTCYYYTDSTLSTCITEGKKITNPSKTGYTYGGYYTSTGGGGTNYINAQGTFINNIYKKIPSEINSNYTDNITLYAKWSGASYTVNYSDNLFAAQTQSTSGVMVTYTENGSYLTLNGTYTDNTLGLWNLERRSIEANDQYKITLSYISGSYTLGNSSDYPSFVMDLTNNGTSFSDRMTTPMSCVSLRLPTSGNSTITLGVDSTRASANGLKYWLWQSTAGNVTFNNYKVQIVITKVHSKSVSYNTQYGALDTPTKTGYTFNGWYTSITGGTKIINTSTYTNIGSQTLYAQWTSHKLNVQYNGASGAKWCGNSNSSYSMDTDKFAVNSSSSRNIGVIPYGQYISYQYGFNDYHNENSICFAKDGYTVPSGNEWVLNGNTSKKYSQSNATYTSQGIASDAGCNLATTETCTARLNTNWVLNSYTVTYDNNLGQMDVWGTSYKDRWTRTYDSGTGLYNISCAGAGGWELLYLPINTTANHQYKVTFDYSIPTAYNSLSGYSGIGYQAVTAVYYNSDLASQSLATSYLPKTVTSKTSGTLNFTATGATSYFVLNFGMAADGTTTTIKFGNVKVYDVTSGKYVFAPSIASEGKTSGTQYGTLASVERTGYTFNGWYTSPSGGTKIETTTTNNATSNQTLYAHWTMGTYTQTYRPNGGSGSNASETVGFWDIWVGKAANTYTREGYTFNCWQSSTSSSCYTAGGWWNTSAGVGTSRYLDATWTPAEYTLTLNANGGSVSPTTKTVTYGTTYTDLPTPTRTGYTFKGWYGSYNGTAAAVVNYGRAYMYTNKLSVHFSAYMSNWANYGRAVSCTETGGWNLETSNGNALFACYDSGIGYKSAISSTAYSSLSAGWHDFDLIFNGTNAKLYIDGSLKATSSNYSSGKIGYNSTNSIFFGGEAIGSATATTSPYFNGYIGNVVIKNTDAITSSSTYNTITAPAQNQTLYAKWVANALTFNNQSISKTFSTSSQTFNVTGASNGTGTYTYTIKSQPSGNYFTISGSTVTMKASTPAGSYSVVITAKDSNSNATKDATYTVTVGKATPTAPTLSAVTVTYNGSSHSIGKSGGTSGLTVQYAYRTWNGSSYGSWSGWGTTAGYYASTGAGKWEIKAKLVGNSNYNDSAESNVAVLTINKAGNPIAVTASQSWTVDCMASPVDKSFTAATGAQGAVTYSIQSQKNGSTNVSIFSIPASSTASLRIAANASGGTYTVVIRATAAGNSNYNSGYKDITMTVTAKTCYAMQCTCKTSDGKFHGMATRSYYSTNNNVCGDNNLKLEGCRAICNEAYGSENVPANTSVNSCSKGCSGTSSTYTWHARVTCGGTGGTYDNLQGCYRYNNEASAKKHCNGLPGACSCYTGQNIC